MRVNDCLGIAFLLVVCLFCSAESAVAQEDDDFPPQGMIAEYASGDTKAVRIDAGGGFRWNATAPDLRLPPGNFSAQWKGQLSVFDDGAYKLYAHVEGGELKVWLDGKQVLSAKAAASQWVASEPQRLRFNDYPLQVTFEKTREAARLTLFWSGPGFPIEPLPASYLTHAAEVAPSNSFERGRQLSRGLRCAACHESAVEPAPVAAPSLAYSKGNLHTAWLVDWLTGKSRHGAESLRRMPGFQLSQADATAIAAVLQTEPSQKSKRRAEQLGDAKQGSQLFHTIGCVACHDSARTAEAGLWAGNDLSQIRGKRPAGFIEKWLEDPASLNPQHRMPVFDLSASQRKDLAAFLTSKGAEPPAAIRQKRDAKTLQHGRELIVANGCLNCHQAPPGFEDIVKNVAKPSRPGRQSNWQSSCVHKPQQKRPGYDLKAEDAAALKSYYSQLPEVTGAVQKPLNRPTPTGAQLLVEMNCVACHQRGEFAGLSQRLPDLAVAHPELASLLPAMKPPSLNSVGDKLKDDALVKAIRRQGQPRRPWLGVRMPRFRMSDKDLSAITSHLIAEDRVPLSPVQPAAVFAEPVVQKSGARLLTAAGFGCVSCHAIGKSKPSDDVIAGRGPALAGLDGRVRKIWFDRWVRNPARITPRMEMPSIQSPVHGVLDGRLQTQLDALWTALNSKNLKLPKLGAVRVVSRSNDPAATLRQRRAAVLTDVLHHNDRIYIKPFIVGMNNQHNVMLDLESASLSGWWRGDVARQLTEGKTWFWEPAGDSALPAGKPRAEWQLKTSAGYVDPIASGQFKTAFDLYEHTPGNGVAVQHRLLFPGENQQRVQVTQTLSPQSNDTTDGFSRELKLSGLKPSQQVRLLPFGSLVPESPQLTAGDRVLTVGRGGVVRLRLETGGLKFLLSGTDVYVHGQADAAGQLTVQLQYEWKRRRSELQLPLATSTPQPPPQPMPLQVAPGYNVVRLPLTPPGEWMPTGLAWSAKGELAVSSLKGRVWLAKDSDADGLEDKMLPFSDELAAPYGLAFPQKTKAGRAVDVINKYALLRFVDADEDGLADKVYNLASGWGHTADYHDWMVGLPSDGKGGYLVAAACQQDTRSIAAARLRGEVLRLTPSQADGGDPAPRYTVQTISKGHRFPMGIARNQTGAVFVTDNQGNYNPFNELNHVIQGARYGFINKVDRAKFAGNTPPFRAPAINIPHPWTRSVNGICFLETPPALKAKRGEIFGPFEGHLIGCEYDTRRLIRMSVRKVGDTYQGAAYPFSLDQPTAGPSLLGPLVAAVSPDGALYVGGIRDSGWGGGNNIGEIVKLTPAASPAPGIAEVRADKNGLRIEFTQKVTGEWIKQAGTYAVTSYRRDSTPAYGGSDKDRKPVSIARIKSLAEKPGVLLELPEMKPGYVYEIKMRVPAQQGQFFPASAYFTFHLSPGS